VLPAGDYAFEVRWDGFRAIASTEDGWRIRSRRGWRMEDRIPELARDDVRGVFDGELIAIDDGKPSFPLVSSRMLHGHREIPVAYAVFDVLALDGESTMHLPYARRRALLEQLQLDGFWFVTPTYDDGEALFRAVCDQALEGVVAKPLASAYRPRERGWVKVKNRDYWRFGQELERAQRRRSVTI
jgi:bifunctional non-homologous end joining protein LigD